MQAWLQFIRVMGLYKRCFSIFFRCPLSNPQQFFDAAIRPVQIVWHTLSPGTSSKSNRQVRTYNWQVPLLIPSPKNWNFNATFWLSKLLLRQTSNNYPDKRNRFVMKCRYKSIGHTFLWVQCKLRYDQASPRDLLRAKGPSPELKLVSPGRRTCELDRPGDEGNMAYRAGKPCLGSSVEPSGRYRQKGTWRPLGGHLKSN